MTGAAVVGGVLGLVLFGPVSSLFLGLRFSSLYERSLETAVCTFKLS
jgi:hypothetical protein